MTEALAQLHIPIRRSGAAGCVIRRPRFVLAPSPDPTPDAVGHVAHAFLERSIVQLPLHLSELQKVVRELRLKVDPGRIHLPAG